MCAGVSVLLTSISNVAAFGAGAFMSIPAIRSFCLQTAIVLAFNCVTIRLVIDMKKKYLFNLSGLGTF
jgi:patched 1 protein